MTHRFTVENDGTVTRVAHEVGFEPRGPARLAAPLMKPLLARMVADLDRQLKSTLSALPQGREQTGISPPASSRWREREDLVGNSFR